VAAEAGVRHPLPKDLQPLPQEAKMGAVLNNVLGRNAMKKTLSIFLLLLIAKLKKQIPSSSVLSTSLFAVALLASAGLAAEKKPIKVFILAGQSNMEGRQRLDFVLHRQGQ
jgi:hypothetical protein